MRKNLQFLFLFIFLVTISISLKAQDITVTIFEDVDGNGTLDGGEQQIAGLLPVLYIDGNGNTMAEAGEESPIPVTDNGDGTYTWSAAPAGDYFVEFPTPPAAASVGTNGANMVPTRAFVNGGLNNDLDSDIEVATGPSGLYITGRFIHDGASDYLDADAGFVAPIIIGDFVFLDRNGNGENNADPGIAVNVTLYESDGTTVALDVNGVAQGPISSAAGNYTFDELYPGDYIVEFDDPSSSYYLTIPDVGGVGTPSDTDSDASPTSGTTIGQTAVFSVTSGSTLEEQRVDAGFFTAARIGDFVFEDVNGDGDQADAIALPGVDITLTRIDGFPFVDVNGNAYAPATITSDGGGNYSFIDLPPGDYNVEFSSAVALPDWYLTMPDIGGAGPVGDTDSDTGNETNNRQTGDVDVTLEVTLANPEGTETTRVDAGFYDPVTIGDLVWDDLDANGLQDGVEVGLPGITVSIESMGAAVNDARGIPLTPVVTPGSGAYAFDLVPPGMYTISFNDPTSMWYLTLPDLSGAGPDGTDDSDAVPIGFHDGGVDVTVISQDIDEEMRVDAGYFNPISIGDMVWNDENVDGIQNEPLVGPTVEFDVTLTRTDGGLSELADGTPLPQTLTTAGGMYEFMNVRPGDYTVTFVPPVVVPSYGFSMVDVGGGNSDANDILTDSDADPVTGVTHTITVTSNEDVVGDPEHQRIDAGVFRCVTIGGDFWTDANGNGIQDGGALEGPVGGCTVGLIDVNTGGTALDCDGNAFADQPAGMYAFQNVPPGTYRVVITSLPGADWYVTLPHQAGAPNDAGEVDNDSDFDQVTLESHDIEVLSEETDEEMRIDGGIFQAASIEILAWHDTQNDGIYNNGDECAEDLMPDEVGFTLLFNGAAATEIDGVTPATFVYNAGIYRAENLAPGVGYQIQAAPGIWNLAVAHYDGTVADIGDGDDTDSDFDVGSGLSPTFELASGPTKTNIDAGFYQNMTLGGMVWVQFDDANGVYDGPPDEARVPDIQMALWVDTDGDGVFETNVGAAATDANGEYMFMNIPPGDYMVEVIRANFDAGTQLEVFQCVSTVFLDDTRETNDGVGPMGTSMGGAEAFPILMRCGCEPDGLINKTVDFGFFFEFDCTENSPDYVALSCEETDPNSPTYNPFFPICDVNILNAFCATMTPIITGNGPTPLCDNGGAPHNITWFSFVAGGGDYTLRVTPGNCTDANGNPPGTGIQNGIYDDCTFSNQIGPCVGIPCSQAPTELSNIDPNTGDVVLIPGQIYYWFLDGCSGTICEFEIDVIGNFIPFDPPCPTGIECEGTTIDVDCTQEVCPGEEILFTLLDFDIEQITYSWSVTPAVGWEVISPIPDPAEPLNTLFNNIELRFNEEGVYTVCWDVVNSKCYSKSRLGTCGNDPALCKEIVVRSFPDEDFGIKYLCQWELDFYNGPLEDEFGNTDPNGDGLTGWQTNIGFWQEGIFGPFEVVRPDGCVYTETVEIVKKPDSDKVRVDTIFCTTDPVEIFGFLYDENDEILDLNLAPDVQAANGCDSFIDLYIWFMNIEGELTGDCGAGSNGDPVFNLEFIENTLETKDAGANTIYTYSWYRTAFGVGDGFELTDGDPDGNPYTFVATEPGEWQLHINMTVMNQTTFEPYAGCTYIFTVNVDPSTFLPPNPVPGVWNLSPCAVDNPPVEYTVEPEEDVVTRWIWPADVASASGDMTDTLTIDWTGSAGGNIGVYFLNDCGSSDTILMPVVLVVVPDPVISIDIDTTCIDSLFTVTSVGPVVGGEEYTWSFSGGVVVGGTATGPGPHQVSWTTEGAHEVTLQVNIGDCLSTIARDTTYTELPIAAPVITCGITTINSVTFNWNPVAGATGYIVEVVQGPASNTGGPQTGTSYTMVDMAEDEEGTIRVIAVTDNPCGNTVSLDQTCKAQDCPAVNITLTADPDTLCFDPSLTPIDINVAFDVTDLTGAGTFSIVGGGPGIADANVGQFDPIAAGIGTHTVLYEYVGTGAVYNNCAYNGSMTFVIYETPTSDFTIDGDNICIDETSTITYTGNTPNGLFDWTVTPDELVPPLDGGGPFAGVNWATAGAKTVSLVVERNGCVSPPTTLPVSVDPLIEQIDVTCGEPTATSVAFEWDPIANTTGYELVVDGGAPITQTTTGYSLGSLTPGTEVTLVVTALSNNLCGNTVDSITCIAQNCPSFVLDLTDDFTMCADEDPVDLMWTITGGLMDGSGFHQWTGNGITDDQSGTFDPATAGIGAHQITLTYWEGPDSTCTDSERMRIEVIDIPVVAYTISDDTICLGEIITVVYGGQPSSLDPVWSQSGGTFIETAPREYEWTFTSAGTYTITAEAFTGNCIAEPVTRTVVVNDQPDEAMNVFCDGSDLDFIRVSWNDLNCASEYEIFVDGVSVGIQPETELSYEFIGLNEGDVRTVRVVPINECDCAVLTEGEETCEATACPPLAIDLNNPLTSLCIDDAPGTTIQLTATVTGNLENGDRVWSGVGVDQNGLFTPAGLDAGDYDLIFTYSENNGNCSEMEMTTITIFPNPIGFATPTDPQCFADNFGSLSIGSLIEGVTYDATLDGQPTSNFVENLAPGFYDVVLTDPANGCQTAFNDIQIVSAPEVVAEIVGDSIILKGLTTTLRVEFRPIENVDSIQWRNNSTGELIECLDIECEVIRVSPEEDTEYCATLFYNDGCILDVCTEVRVNEDPDITIPNIINPLGDVNTVFYVPHNGSGVEGQGFELMKSMLIYNRWGELVYRTENIPGIESELKKNGWDGRFKGKSVNPGVYVYVIEIIDRDPDTGQAKETADIYTGDVTVLR